MEQIKPINIINKNVNELKKICKEHNINGISKKNKQQLIDIIHQKEFILNSSQLFNIDIKIEPNKNNKTLDKVGLIDFYNTDLKHYENYKKLCVKHNCKTRLPCLSEIVSENLIKFCLIKNKINCVNSDNGGDLLVDNNLKYECKCFTSEGPISFGPTEKWDKIVFMDGRKWFQNEFKIILINLKNTDNIWYNIKMNKNETFKDQCEQKRRPRICWDALKIQIPNDYVNIIFEGKIEDLF